MYEISGLFWYRALFMAELMIAEALTVFRLKRRSHFALRLIASVIVCLGFSFAIPIVAYNALWCSVMFLSMFLVTALALKFCFEERWFTIFFCAVTAYTLQHVAYQIFDFYTLLIGNPSGQLVYGSESFDFPASNVQGAFSFFGEGPFIVMSYLYIYGIVYFLGVLFTKPRLKNLKETGLSNAKMLIFAVIILFFDIVISSILTYWSQQDAARLDVLTKYLVFLDIYNVFCCIFALYLLYATDRQGKLENELHIITRLWDEKGRQYGISKENIDLINQKCHDLKHQIRRIGSQSALDAEVVRDMENVISIYDSSVKTGNEALDVILTEKSLMCNSRNIKLCCMIDGKEMDFMSPVDMYALFGNIFDNAIEGVDGIEESKRTITLNVKKAGSFVIVNTYNYYEGKLSFEGQLPKTTQADTKVHGYGMKSIAMICSKYDGELSITTENGIFTLNIVFPREQHTLIT